MNLENDKGYEDGWDLGMHHAELFYSKHTLSDVFSDSIDKNGWNHKKKLGYYDAVEEYKRKIEKNLT